MKLFNKSLFQSTAFYAVICFWASAATIILLTYPWVLHFGDGFLNHWDPPFHAWKLKYMATEVLRGNLFFHNPNSNVLYPYSGTLFFEALQWPQALFGALILLFFPLCSDVLLYHISLIFFWALSAPCFYLLMKRMGVSNFCSIVFSLIWTILPWRISYAPEYQMQFVYAMPLYFLAIINLFTSEKIKVSHGLFLAFSIWLQAVSELYQAVFLVMITPFLVLPYLILRWDIMKQRRFWVAALSAVVLGLALVAITLLPYLWQQSSGTVYRPLSEVRRHSAFVLSYLLPGGIVKFWKFKHKVLHDEFSLYPTLPLLIGSLLFLARTICVQKGKLQRGLLGTIASLIIVFFVLAIVLLPVLRPDNPFAFKVWHFIPLLILALTFIVLFIPSSQNDRYAPFMKGLGVAAIICFFLSLGPLISPGNHGKEALSFSNKFYLFVYNHFSFVSNFRVVSRFGVIVLTAMTIASALGFDRIGTKMNRKWVKHLVILVILAVVAVEAKGTFGISKYRYPDKVATESRIVKSLHAQPGLKPLMILPYLNRMEVGNYMFSLLGDDANLVYLWAWGGYFPEKSLSFREATRDLEPENMRKLIGEIYPECTILADKRYANDELISKYGLFAEKVDEDETFVLFKSLPPRSASKLSKFIRTDVIRKNRHLILKAKGEPSAMVTLSLNEAVLYCDSFNEEGLLEIDMILPKVSVRQMLENSISLSTDDGTPLEITTFDLSSEK